MGAVLLCCGDVLHYTKLFAWLRFNAFYVHCFTLVSSYFIPILQGYPPTMSSLRGHSGHRDGISDGGDNVDASLIGPNEGRNALWDKTRSF